MSKQNRWLVKTSEWIIWWTYIHRSHVDFHHKGPTMGKAFSYYTMMDIALRASPMQIYNLYVFFWKLKVYRMRTSKTYTVIHGCTPPPETFFKMVATDNAEKLDRNLHISTSDYHRLITYNKLTFLLFSVTQTCQNKQFLALMYVFVTNNVGGGILWTHGLQQAIFKISASENDKKPK